LILILAAIGIVLAIVAGYYVIRFMRGSIKLTMVRTGYNAGDTITGSFELHTKKPIEGNKLTVSLIGTQVTRTRRGGKTRTESHEIYRNETVIEGPTRYPAEHRSTHEFEIATPNSQTPDFANNPIFQGLATAMGMLSDRQTYLKWRVEARLDAKGVDLVASKKVTVNGGGLM
jgi:hypothetical protein